MSEPMSVSAPEAVDGRIVRFIGRHHVMTLATVSAAGLPYCANLFYAYLPERNLFVFTTDTTTRHGSEMAACAHVAASVVLETRTVGLVQGLQIEGTAERPEGELLQEARNAYIRRFPYAAVADLSLWTLAPTLLKLTDNKLGFGKKLIWHG